jgi:peroxiredoxin
VLAPSSHDPSAYDYAIIRVVPRVEREEFVNVGVILSCPAKDFLEARLDLDEARLRALDPEVDVASVRQHLASIPVICAGGEAAGPIGKLSPRERFHWLVAPRSTIIQTSPVHTGRCSDPHETLEHLLEAMVRPPRASLQRMQRIERPAITGAQSSTTGREGGAMTINVGDTIPPVKVKMMTKDGIKDITTDELFKGKVAAFGLPGAFTPTCSAKHLPGFIQHAEMLKGKGVDKIVCLSVNDAFVMDAWGKQQGSGDKVMMVADGSGDLTRALGLELDLTANGMGKRMKRFSMVVQDGVVKAINVEKPGAFEVSNAETILGQV